MLLRACIVALVCAIAGAASADTITGARYVDPTDRYPHGVLGDAIEWGGIEIETGAAVGQKGGLFNASRTFTWSLTLPEDRVFEDLDPRLWDITGDGDPELVLILTQQDLGASLIAMGLEDGKPVQIAATNHIGQTNRWLAPIGAADLDGDGRIEIGYIDRPHLAKVLRLVVKDGDRLVQVSELAGLTNHRIGQDFITGGVRDCGQGPEMITLNADWSQVMATRYDGARITARPIAAFTGPESVSTALDCAG